MHIQFTVDRAWILIKSQEQEQEQEQDQEQEQQFTNFKDRKIYSRSKIVSSVISLGRRWDFFFLPPFNTSYPMVKNPV